MGLRSRARSSPNNPYVRHHKVSPSPNPHLKARNSIYIERLPFAWKTRKFREEFKWNGSSRWKILWKKGNTFRSITFFQFLPRIFWPKKKTEIFCTICLDYQCQASCREKVKNVLVFCKWYNSIPSLFSASKKDTSTIWRKFFAEISVQMISAH